jgi:hypothetical protein
MAWPFLWHTAFVHLKGIQGKWVENIDTEYSNPFGSATIPTNPGLAVDPVQGWGYEGDIDWVPVEFFGSLIVS